MPWALLMASEAAVRPTTLGQVESVFSDYEQKLAEIYSATEVATSEMLDGLDRALILIDQIEVAPSSSDADADPRDELREELHALVTLMQFQDITAQQLGSASTLLEDRMIRLAEVFDLSS